MKELLNFLSTYAVAFNAGYLYCQPHRQAVIAWLLPKGLDETLGVFSNCTRGVSNSGQVTYTTPVGFVFVDNPSVHMLTQTFKVGDMTYFYPDAIKQLLKSNMYYRGYVPAEMELPSWANSKEKIVAVLLKRKTDKEEAIKAKAKLKENRRTFVKDTLGDCAATEQNLKLIGNLWTFDHYYQYSDDSEVYRRCKKELAQLLIDLKKAGLNQNPFDAVMKDPSRRCN